MKKASVSLLLLVMCLTGGMAQATTERMIWGDAAQVLPQLKQNRLFMAGSLPKTIQTPSPSPYELKLLHSDTMPLRAKHSHYQIEYKGVPVWGHQLVFHAKPGAKMVVTGVNVSDIEADVSSIEAQLTPAAVQKQILASIQAPVKFKTINKIIFIDDQHKAHLAYHLFFYTNTQQEMISSPNYIVDANNGDVLKQWDNAHLHTVGQGMGGNSLSLPYRAGMFQYGHALPGLPSLGKFDVDERDGQCYVENKNVRVMNLDNAVLGYDAFPISVSTEAATHLSAHAYPCTAKSLYLNYADGITGPVNYAFSPINDTMYFAQQTIDMYQHVYGVDKPLGDDLPIRAYTHLGKMDNAFAIPTIRNNSNGELFAHQQIIIGNGDQFLTAPSQAVVAHELSHNFTELNSGLMYWGQSGGINESFSDMAAIALEDHVREQYPWYWDGSDWSIGREAMISGTPLRYMDDPTQDGLSIGHASDYYEGIDVHHSSGVFNKAFYLLAHKPGWSIKQAFQVMVDANQVYWSPLAYYDFAACGVIQATVDRHLDPTPVVEAFAEVGVTCPI